MTPREAPPGPRRIRAATPGKPGACRGHTPRRTAVAALIIASVAALFVAVDMGVDAPAARGATDCTTEVYHVGDQPRSLAVADFNDDGQPDVATANRNLTQKTDSISVLLNDGEGGFSPRRQPLGLTYPVRPEAVVAADVDGDGHPDLATANTLENTVSVLPGYGDGTFGPPVDYPTGVGASGEVPFGRSATAAGVDPVDLVAVDVDGDAAVDLATANTTSGDVSVLRNTGTGVFVAPLVTPVGDPAEALAVARLDGDDHPDLAVAIAADPEFSGDHSVSELAVLSGNGIGTFGQPAGMGAASRYSIGPTRGVVAAHLNDDDHLDLATSDDVLVNTASPDLTLDVTDLADGDPGGGVAAADLTGDGHTDLATTEGFVDEVSVLDNTGDATFTELAECPTGAGPVAVAAADVAGDHRPELLTANTRSATLSVVQTPQATGAVAGTVTDAHSGRPLEGAAVTATPDSGGETISTRTDDAGHYRVSDLEPQTYTVTADADGYQSQTEQAVTVTSRETATVDFALTRPRRPAPRSRAP